MDQTQAKALAALQPFIVEATTTKNPSPRYLRELIVRVTSAQNTYIFTELLQTAAIQTLQTADAESRAYLTLLEIFSWGTYEEYTSTPNLPTLNESQTLKLRQLTLLTLASPFAPATMVGPASPAYDPLSYPSLLAALQLPSAAALEGLVTSAIYNSLLTARLSPNSTPPAVHITSVAPLRDLRPQSLPALTHILNTWSQRCDAVINSLTSQITAIQTQAAQRTAQRSSRQRIVDTAVVTNENEQAKSVRPRDRKGNKRDLDERMEGEDDRDVSSDEIHVKMLGADDEVDDAKPSGSGIPRGSKRNRGKKT